MMTATIVDDMTDTMSNKDRECAGQGLGNVVAGCFGGMAGCAMIGQSVINVKSGGRGRLSTLFAGLFLLFLILVLGDWARRIPMAALVAVMIMVSIGTLNWASLRTLLTHPKQSSFAMLTTVVVVVTTHDLAKGVLAGVLLSTIFFAMKVERIFEVVSELRDEGRTRVYRVSGQVFFASAEAFVGRSTSRMTSTGSRSTSSAPTSGTSRPSAPWTRSSSSSAGRGSRSISSA
jgi:SulP family sulfate permease